MATFLTPTMRVVRFLKRFIKRRLGYGTGRALLVRRLPRNSVGMEIAVMLRTIQEIEVVVKNHSFGKKTADENWKLYVVFLKDEPALAGKRSLVGISGELEIYSVRDREVYSALHKSHPKPTFSGNFVEKHLKTSATARNWNTVNKILKLGTV